MNYYETLYIVHPALESGRLKDIIVDVEDNLKKLGGKPLAVELWGKRKLSYFIDKQKYGTYILLQYSGEGKCSNDFAVELEHNPNVLAYLTTSINSDDVIEMKEDLDTQIAGKTRDSEHSGTSKEVSSSESDNKGDEENKSNNNESVESQDKKNEQEEETDQITVDKDSVEQEEETDQIIADEDSVEKEEETDQIIADGDSVEKEEE